MIGDDEMSELVDVENAWIDGYEEGTREHLDINAAIASVGIEELILRHDHDGWVAYASVRGKKYAWVGLNPEVAIRRELAVLWEQAELAATTDVLYTKEQAIESAQERIAAAVEEQCDMTIAYMVGYRKGQEERPVVTYTTSGKATSDDN